MVCTGTQLIVWGGYGGGFLDDGGRYDPGTDTWLPTSVEGAPIPRYAHTTVWTGSEMILWGGSEGSDIQGPFVLDTGGRYCAQ